MVLTIHIGRDSGDTYLSGRLSSNTYQMYGFGQLRFMFSHLQAKKITTL